MGSTDYFAVTISVRELLGLARIASEGDGWSSLTIDERIQREVNLGRIKKTIVPYLATHSDRFFGSFILLAPQEVAVEFEPLSELVTDLPRAYATTTGSIGYLTLPEGGQLIALDGQHRLTALREVVLRATDLGGNALQVANDNVLALIVRFETLEKTRRIFNKVNRNAKPTGKSDNIITSEDDGYAIVTRRLLSPVYDGPFAERALPSGNWQPVEWLSTSIARHSDRFTTLATLYEATVDLLKTVGGYRGFSETDDPVAPEDNVLDEATEFASRWFREWMESPAIRDLTDTPSQLPGIRGSAIDARALLTRPVGQLACLKGLIRAWSLERERSFETLKELAARLSTVDWSPSPLNCWRDLIVRPDGSMLSRKEGIDLAADLVCYLISENFGDDATQRLFEAWNKKRGRDPFSPIDDLEEEAVPEDLPLRAWA